MAKQRRQQSLEKAKAIRKTVQDLLNTNFDMKYLEEVNGILGIKITRSEKEIFMVQSHYVEKILKKYNYFDCKPALRS